MNRFIGGIMVGYFWGSLVHMAIPEEEFAGIDFRFLYWLVPAGVAFGVWLVGNVGQEEGNLFTFNWVLQLFDQPVLQKFYNSILTKPNEMYITFFKFQVHAGGLYLQLTFLTPSVRISFLTKLISSQLLRSFPNSHLTHSQRNGDWNQLRNDQFWKECSLYFYV